MGPHRSAEAGPQKTTNRKPEVRPERKITVLPTGQQFAVVRMDPLAMVLHLDLDSIAVEEATAMRPKKYLIYVDAPQDLPFPQSQWCRYWVEPVATTLRPAVPEKGITPDMVLPIHPNTQYAKGRQPVQCTPPFPFPDCYFWMQSTMSLRVRTKRGLDVYDNDRARTVSTRQHVAFMNAWNEDFRRMVALRRGRSPDNGVPTPASEGSGNARKSPPPRPAQRDAVRSVSASTPWSPPPLRHFIDESNSSDEDEGSVSDSSQMLHGEPAPAPTLPPIPPLIELAIDTNVFGWAADPKVPFIPLVDLWFELEDHLSPDSIPSPTELWREQETIGRIIDAALKRRAIATMPPQAPSAPRGDAQKSQRPVVPPGHGSPRSSDVDSGVRQDGSSRDRLDSKPPSRRPPSPTRPRPELLDPHAVRKAKLDNSSHKAEAQVTPGTSFASLFQSMAPLGNHIASWGFRSPVRSSQPAPSAPAPTSRPQSPPSPRAAAGRCTSPPRTSKSFIRHTNSPMAGSLRSHRKAAT